MPKATLTLPSGAKIIVEGSADEVEGIIRRLGGPGEKRARGKAAAAEASRKAGRAVRDYVLELREAGLFKKPQGLADIKNGLQAEGHIVPITTLSGVMLDLVKSKELRRSKDKKTWKYVNR